MCIVIIFIVIALIINFRHTKVKFKTFLRKGFAPKRGRFGIYCYCGKQGSGKTYSAVEFLINNNVDKVILYNDNNILIMADYEINKESSSYIIWNSIIN